MFYNPGMAVDRDLGVAFANAHFEAGGHAGWEMLAATGVRGLRLLAETGRFSSFAFTEAQPMGLEVLATNASSFHGARVVPGDARRVRPGGEFDYVDLDPYGSPLPFLSSAFASVVDGGVLAVTATDMMVLAGAQSAACQRLYGARPIRGRLGPEGGLRILLARLALEARSRRLGFRVLLGYVRDHHVRAYVSVGGESGADDPVRVIDPASWEGPWVGDRGPYGPFWLGPLVAPELAARLTAPPTASDPATVGEFLDSVRAEALVDRPFYYEPNELAGRLHLPSPRSLAYYHRALAGAGYRVAPTHARPEGFRTTAPRSAVERAARGE